MRTAPYVLPVLIGCKPAPDRTAAPWYPHASATTSGSEPIAVTVPSPARNVHLPSSTAALAPGPAEIYVALTSTDLRVGLGNEGRTVATIPAGADRTLGFPAEYKRSERPQDYFVMPLGEAVRAKSGVAAPLHAQLALEASTPYRTVTEILYTLSQSEVAFFELLVRNGDRVTAIRTVAPSAGSARVPSQPTLNLAVIVVHDGISIKATGGNVAPGCNGVGAGLAIPRAPGGGHDFAALRQCATKVRSVSPEFERETQVVVIANADVDFQTVVDILDALRTTDTGAPMFTDPVFGFAH